MAYVRGLRLERSIVMSLNPSSFFIVHTCWQSCHGHNPCHTPGQYLSDPLQIVCSNLSALVMIPASLSTSQAHDLTHDSNDRLTLPAMITWTLHKRTLGQYITNPLRYDGGRGSTGEIFLSLPSINQPHKNSYNWAVAYYWSMLVWFGVSGLVPVRGYLWIGLVYCA